METVCRLEMYEKDVTGEFYPTGSATGFFYTKDGKLYLVTNKHVVQRKTGKLEDMLRIFPPQAKRFIDLELRDTDGRRLWKTGTDVYEDVDVAVLEIPKEKISSRPTKSESGTYFALIKAKEGQKEKSIYLPIFSKEDLLPESPYLPGEKIPVGSSALVLGFPMDFYDKAHPYPMVRGATVATIPWYDLQIEGRKKKPCFLIDATLQEGMSGSPVVSSPEKESRYIFNWNRVLREDGDKLRSFLKERYNIEWIKDAKIEQPDSTKIRLSSGWKSIEIFLSDDKTKAIVKLNLHKSHELEVKREKGELNVYELGYGNVYLLGIYSSEWVVGIERLGLQNAWHAILIEKILEKNP